MASIDCTQTYLGNYFQKRQLQQKIDTARSLDGVIDIELTQAEQKKSRIYTKTKSGDAIGLLKKRDWTFTDGDVFQLEGDRFLLIHLHPQILMTLSLESNHSTDLLKLIYLGHTLGNHHYPIVVTVDKIYVQIPDDSSHLETSIKELNIKGLRIGYETRWQSLPEEKSPDQILQFTHHSHD
ncbi:MAG: urease accessory protein UreE [Cyanobacteria bacterium P01_F01_bin.150]